MLKEVTIEGGWYRYKTDTPLRPGKYFQLDARNPPQVLRRQLGLIAAQLSGTGRGEFRWLAPHEDWVRWVVQGLWVKEQTVYGEDGHEEWLRETIGAAYEAARPYQQRFVRDAVACLARGWDYRRACLMGLGGGKTLAALMLGTLGEHCVVLAPRHVHDTWRNEAAKWGLPCPTITTYESAHRLENSPIDVLILDEVLRVKSPEAQRTAATKALSARARIVVALTGTPTGGRGPLDWMWLDCVRPGSVPTEAIPWQFLFSTATELKEKGGRKCYDTPARSWDTEKIAQFVGPHIYRVDTSELLRHLPPIQFNRVALPKPKDWEAVTKGVATARGTMKRVSQARMLSDGFVYDDGGVPVRVNSDKASAIETWVEGLGEPVIVVARWRESITHLAKVLAAYRPAVVASESADVGYQLRRFTSGETQVLIISARYGEGIDGLQDRCRLIGFMSNGSHNDRKQMIGRVFRHGQNTGVVVTDFVCEGTLDIRQLELISEQSDLSEAQVDKILAEEAGL